MEDIEKLKSEGWIEYDPNLNLVVVDENDNILEQPKTIHLYKTEGKQLMFRAITPRSPIIVHLPFPK